MQYKEEEARKDYLLIKKLRDPWVKAVFQLEVRNRFQVLGTMTQRGGDDSRRSTTRVLKRCWERGGE